MYYLIGNVLNRSQSGSTSDVVGIAYDSMNLAVALCIIVMHDKNPRPSKFKKIHSITVK